MRYFEGKIGMKSINMRMIIFFIAFFPLLLVSLALSIITLGVFEWFVFIDDFITWAINGKWPR